MSIITLTDRISVSVRAKNETERSSQSKATGANIQKALGGSGLSDSDLESIGNVNSIADEQGNEWIKMEDIIAAGRKMKEKGAFSGEYYSYPGDDTIGAFNFMIGNGIITFAPNATATNPYYSTDIIRNGAICEPIQQRTYYYYTSRYDRTSGQIVCGYVYEIIDKVEELGFKNASGGNGSPYYVSPGTNVTDYNAYGKLIRGNKEYLYRTYRSGHNDFYGMSIDPWSISNDTTYNSASRAAAMIGSNIIHHGSSIIDWDAPNAEVERQIKELHETWDVSEHPGASGQGVGAGTYVLAGPIEFNDADPVG